MCTNTLNNCRYGLDFRNPSHPPHTHTGALLAAAAAEPTSGPPSSWAGPARPPRPHLLQSGEGAPFLGVHLPALSISICSGCLSFCSRPPLFNMGPWGGGEMKENEVSVSNVGLPTMPRTTARHTAPVNCLLALPLPGIVF